jgi:hypothetical protein
MNKEIQCLLNHAWAHLLAEASHCRVGRVPLQAHVSATSSHLGPARQRPGLFLAVSGQATNPTRVTRCPQPTCFFPNSPEPLPCSGHARCRCDSRPCHDTGLRMSSPRPPPSAPACSRCCCAAAPRDARTSSWWTSARQQAACNTHHWPPMSSIARALSQHRAVPSCHRVTVSAKESSTSARTLAYG